MKQRIGMVGIGLMGHGIATNLVRHGHALTVFEHSGNQPLDALLAAGARTATHLADLAAGSDILITVLTGSPQVEAVVLGEGGLLAGMRPGTVVVDCSTAIPASTAKVAAAVEAAGGRFLDCPMTRTPKEAAEGRLNLLVGGEAALLAQMEPVLRCFAENITHVGPAGAGHGMKLLHNYVSLGMVTLLAEAAACATRSGVDPAAFVQVLAQGGGGGIALERIKPYLLAQDTSGLKFTIANACKDLGYYATMATDAQAQRQVAQAVLATLQGGLDQGGPQALVPELAGLLARGA